MSTTVYSQVLIYTAESTGASMERTKMPNLRNGNKMDSNQGTLDCESDTLPLSYRAPRQLPTIDTGSTMKVTLLGGDTEVISIYEPGEICRQ